MTKHDTNSNHSAPIPADFETETRIAIKIKTEGDSPAPGIDKNTNSEVIPSKALCNSPPTSPDPPAPPQQPTHNNAEEYIHPTPSLSDRRQGAQEPSNMNAQIILNKRFVLEEVIARGGMGVVYKARDLRKEEYQDRNPYVAIKVLNEECKTHPDFFMALQREARKAQQLAHPNIVTVHDFDADGDTVFMTMEYLVGQTLDVFIKENLPSPHNHKILLKIVNDMGLGLAYAHKNHIVHCDFKPGNVFLTRDGTVKILDFGISRAAKHPDRHGLDATVFDAGKLGALTPPYASCEMLDGVEPDQRDDIYALACITYELLTGQHPFNREKATLARSKSTRAPRIKGLNKQRWNGILSGLEFNRKARTPTVKQFLLDFNAEASLPSKKGYRSIALGLTALSVTTSAAFFYYLTSLDKENISTISLPTNPPVSSEETTSDRFLDNNLSPELQDKIDRLLEAADIHFIVGRITEPPGSNAYDAYRQILKINPQDMRAKAGLYSIADHYEGLASERLRSNDLKMAQSLIMTGLEVHPKHPGLLALNKKANITSGQTIN